MINIEAGHPERGEPIRERESARVVEGSLQFLPRRRHLTEFALRGVLLRSG